MLVPTSLLETMSEAPGDVPASRTYVVGEPDAALHVSVRVLPGAEPLNPDGAPGADVHVGAGPGAGPGTGPGPGAGPGTVPGPGPEPATVTLTSFALAPEPQAFTACTRM